MTEVISYMIEGVAIAEELAYMIEGVVVAGGISFVIEGEARKTIKIPSSLSDGVILGD